MFKKIVVGSDGTKTASAAVEHAIALAGATGAEVIVVTGYPEEGRSPFEGSTIELARRVADEIKQRYRTESNVRAVIREGAPADALCEAAEQEGADVIVVGSRGMSKDPRFGTGSVPNAVSHHAPCNVLIVHTSNE